MKIAHDAYSYPGERVMNWGNGAILWKMHARGVFHLFIYLFIWIFFPFQEQPEHYQQTTLPALSGPVRQTETDKLARVSVHTAPRSVTDAHWKHMAESSGDTLSPLTCSSPRMVLISLDLHLIKSIALPSLPPPPSLHQRIWPRQGYESRALSAHTAQEDLLIFCLFFFYF